VQEEKDPQSGPHASPGIAKDTTRSNRINQTPGRPFPGNIGKNYPTRHRTTSILSRRASWERRLQNAKTPLLMPSEAPPREPQAMQKKKKRTESRKPAQPHRIMKTVTWTVHFSQRATIKALPERPEAREDKTATPQPADHRGKPTCNTGTCPPRRDTQ